MELYDFESFEVSEEEITIVSRNKKGIPCTDVITAGSLTFWKDALGVDSYSDAILGYLHYANTVEEEFEGLEPEENKEAMRSAREAIRVKRSSANTEMRKAEEEGTQDDPRSPKLRAMTAELSSANKLEEFQSSIHRLVKLDHQVAKTSVSSRSSRFQIEDKTECPKWNSFCQDIDTTFKDILGEWCTQYTSREVNGNGS